MHEVFIPTQNFQAFSALCDDLLRTPLGLEMGCVIGPAGRGKTKAAERTAVMSPDTVYLRHQERLTHIGVIRELAFALAGARPSSAQHCFELIQTELAHHRRIIMVDEADRMSVRHLNTLRDIHDLCKVPVVMIGEEPLKAKLGQERRLSSRVAYEMRFEPIGVGDVRTFYKLALGQVLSPSHASLLARRSDGDFRLVVNDAIRLERAMKASGLSAVSDELLKEVCGDNGVPHS